MSALPRYPVPPEGREPAWEIALTFPDQGEWSDIDYLEATSSSSRLVELVQGRIEFPVMPTPAHQQIVLHLLLLIREALSSHGIVLMAPLRVRIGDRSFREPDLVVLVDRNDARRSEAYWDGADLVLEVVSNDERSQQRDWVEKRRDYAQAGIREYWVVDPQQECIAVFSFAGDAYEERGRYGRGDSATSGLLASLRVAVSDVLDAPDR